jgi:hypothetical protein
MKNNIGLFCPGFCPGNCGPHEIMCPGGLDNEGCPIPDQCMPTMLDHNGLECPSHCPIMNCGPDEMICPGGINCLGCLNEDTCISQKGTINV